MSARLPVRIVDCEQGVSVQFARRLVDKLSAERSLEAIRLADTRQPGEDLDQRQRSEFERAALIVLLVTDRWDTRSLDSVCEVLEGVLDAKVPVFVVYLDHVVVASYVEYFERHWPRGGELEDGNPRAFDYSELVERNPSRAAHRLARTVLATLSPPPASSSRRHRSLGRLITLVATGALPLLAWFQHTPLVSKSSAATPELIVIADEAAGLELCAELRRSIADLDLRCFEGLPGVAELGALWQGGASDSTLVIVRASEILIIVERGVLPGIEGAPAGDRRLGPFDEQSRDAIVTLLEIIMEHSRGLTPIFDPERRRSLSQDVELLALGLLITLDRDPSVRFEWRWEQSQGLVPYCARPDATYNRRWLCEVTTLFPPTTEDHCLDDLHSLFVDVGFSPTCEGLAPWRQEVACLNAELELLGFDYGGEAKLVIDAIDEVARRFEHLNGEVELDDCPSFSVIADEMAVELVVQLEPLLGTIDDERRRELHGRASRWACLAARSHPLTYGVVNADLVLNWAELRIVSGVEQGGLCSDGELLAMLDRISPSPRTKPTSNPKSLAAALFAWVISPTPRRRARVSNRYAALPAGEFLRYFDDSQTGATTGLLIEACYAVAGHQKGEVADCLCDVVGKIKNGKLSL